MASVAKKQTRGRKGRTICLSHILCCFIKRGLRSFQRHQKSKNAQSLEVIRLSQSFQRITFQV